ncbi:protein kinase [Bradymonadales bacterium TMQ1]|nr:protein kinase [Bradymonadales bacterium TMQ1]
MTEARRLLRAPADKIADPILKAQICTPDSESRKICANFRLLQSLCYPMLRENLCIFSSSPTLTHLWHNLCLASLRPPRVAASRGGSAPPPSLPQIPPQKRHHAVKTDTLPPGSAVGQYHVIRKLGEGAAGQVYLAHHKILDRDFALKILHPEWVGNDQLTRRFFQEARHATRLKHPNIVGVITADQHKDFYYLVMEFVDGVCLEDILTRQQRLPAERAIPYIVGVLRGLEHAHHNGMLHRDVKADNIIVESATDRARLLDFGLVKDTEATQKLTAQHAVVGTPYYMPPEQWRGEEVDARADIYSAAVTLYYALSGRFPFPGRSPLAVAHRLMSEPHDPLGSIQLFGQSTSAPKLVTILDRALARERDLRPSSASQLAGELEQWLEQQRPAPTAKTSSRSFAYAPPHAEPTMNIPSPNLVTEPVEIAPNTYWVGKRPPNEIFYANPYLRHFPGEQGQEDFNLIIDPGSTKDFSVVQAKVGRVIGTINNLSSIFINHQDPDVGSSVGVLLGRHTPNAHVLCTEDTWRLIQYYNVPRERFVALERFPRGIKLPTGDVVRPVPSPFCHFVGAMMLYDPTTRVLFTGDLFGSLTDKDAEGLYVDESDWAGMRAFHQIYMPTQGAVRYALSKIRELTPAVEIIAPQHGRVLRGHWVKEYIDRLWNLPVGLDILDDRHSSPEELQAWTTVLNRLVEVARQAIGDEVYALLESDPNLSGILSVNSGAVEITSLGKTTVERAVRLICEHVTPDVASAIKYEAVYSANELSLPTPMVELDEDGPEVASSQLDPVADAGFSKV